MSKAVTNSSAANTTTADILIIGAGIIGVCCARTLQLNGHRVTLLDREGIGAACSHGNAGVLCSWSFDPAAKPGLWKELPRWLADPLGPIALRPSHLPKMLGWLWQFIRNTQSNRQAKSAAALFTLNNPTVEMFRQLLQGSGHESLVQDAFYLFATRNGKRLNLNQLPWQRRLQAGATVEAIDAATLGEIEPHLSKEYVKAILVHGQGRVTNPGRLVKVIGDKVLSSGGRFIQTAVHELIPRTGGAVTVSTQNGSIEAKQVVVASGAWSSRLTAKLDLNIPLQAERGYHMEFANPGVQLNNSVNDVDRAFVASSMAGGLRCAGTSEFTELEAAPNWRRADIMKRLGKAMLPGLNVDEGTPWMGLRPALPDSVPIIGPAGHHPGIFLAFGHGHYGLSGAPMTARIIGALIGAERMNIDISAYSVERFT
ncbi:MAG: FAD-dependent oxidoreductase [Gammaproteobacteria bacterium]|nr:FAD-dependent oxidoreductase [Gammaproteobacteria bacterium]